MSVTVPQFGTLPNSDTMTESQFNDAWNNYFANANPYGAALNALGAEAENNAARAEAAVAEVANTVWVSGTTYTAGQVRYSPIDFLSYRRKTNGAGTTDPSLDPTNWALQTKTSNGGSDTASSATDISLIATSGRLQIITMTAPGKKVTMPSATTLNKGAPVFVLQNAGTYRFSVHKNGGGFLCYVQPGQLVAVHCSDISSAAGVWQVSGENVEKIYSNNNAEVLNAVDSRYIAVAMLSATQAICAFRNNSTTFLNAVVLNCGSASGLPAAVNAEASLNISIAAQTSSQATVVYKTSTGVTKAVVLDITSSTTFSAGTIKQIDAATGGTGTAVAAMSSTQLLAVYHSTASTSPKMRVLDIVSSAVNESAQVDADATTTTGAYFDVEKIAAGKAAVAFRNSSDRIQVRLQSITGSTPAPTGSVLDLSAIAANMQNSQFGMVALSASRAVIVAPFDRLYFDFVVYLIDVSGSTPVLLKNKLFTIGSANTQHVTATKLDANSLYVSIIGGESLGVDGIKIRISADDNILLGEISENTEPGVTSSGFYAACAALDSTHVMQVCRNASTFLSAKTLELGA